MSSFDFGGLSTPQLDALCSCAFGGYGAACSPRSLAVLEREGMIESFDRRVGSDRFGLIIVKAWVTPPNVHLEFCEWCAANYTGED